MQILQQLIQGLSLGSIYGLVALGYVLIYQAWGVLNFAQGEVCAIGAFSLLVLHVELGMPVILAMPLAIIVSMIVGYIIEFLSFRPHRISYRIDGIVGNRKRRHFHTCDMYGLIRPHTVKQIRVHFSTFPGFPYVLYRALCCINGYRIFSCNRAKPADMIGMFVCDEDGFYLIKRQLPLCQPLFNSFLTDSGIQ